MIFDGKKYSKERTKILRGRVLKMPDRPGLVIFQVGDDPASKIFIDLKIKKGLELGVVVEHVKLPAGDISSLEQLVRARSLDAQVDGVMVQLPAVGIEKEDIEKVLSFIPVEKDVDGLNPASGVVPAVLRAVMSAFDEYKKIEGDPELVAVLGSRGNLGKKIVKMFEGKKISVLGLDIEDDISQVSKADLVVLATGQASLISEKMIKDGTGVIDLGAPKGEFENISSR